MGLLCLHIRSRPCNQLSLSSPIYAIHLKDPLAESTKLPCWQHKEEGLCPFSAGREHNPATQAQEQASFLSQAVLSTAVAYCALKPMCRDSNPSYARIAQLSHIRTRIRIRTGLRPMPSPRTTRSRSSTTFLDASEASSSQSRNSRTPTQHHAQSFGIGFIHIPGFGIDSTSRINGGLSNVVWFWGTTGVFSPLYQP